MSVDVSKLKTSKVFENEKIKILFSIGMISESLSVYIKDEYGKKHHIIWDISPDRCWQSFDKANEKIRAFVQDKIDEWVEEEEEVDRLRKEFIQNRKKNGRNRVSEFDGLFLNIMQMRIFKNDNRNRNLQRDETQRFWRINGTN